MKIVSVMTTASTGGAEFAAVALLDALAGAGHEAVLLSNQTGIARGSRIRERHVELGPKLSVRTAGRLTLAAPLLLGRLARALRAEAPYDALLVHFKKEQLLAAALPRSLRPALLWAEWGPVPAPMRQGLPNRVYRRAGRPVQAVLAVSAGTRRSVVDAGIEPARVHVVPNVVDAAEIRPDPEGGRRVRAGLGIPDDAFVIVCMSRFHPDKRNDVAIDAALELARDAGGPPVHLVLAGEGETEPALRARAAPLGDAAHFLAMPRREELSAVWSAGDAAVFCPAPAEGAPRSVITAMLAERPCVATGPEGVVDLLVPGTGAIGSPAHDPHAVAELLRAYRDDPARAQGEGAAARARAAEIHDPGSIVSLVERLLTSR